MCVHIFSVSSSFSVTHVFTDRGHCADPAIGPWRWDTWFSISKPLSYLIQNETECMWDHASEVIEVLKTAVSNIPILH